MPIFRFETMIGLARNVRAFLKGGKALRKPGQLDKAGSAETGTLPDFVIIGAQRCGTTFLYDLLGRHPRVEPAAKKEIHYFDLHYNKGDNWYRSHFPPPVWEERRRSITGESSPYYLFHPTAARRMAEVVPKARLILLLRDPVDRAYSHYHHQVRRGDETLGFEEAIDAEEARLRGERERMLEDEYYRGFNHQHFSYLSKGVYVDQLAQWSRFFDADQILVLKSENLFDRMPEALAPVLDFLGLSRWRPETAEPRLEGRYPPMDPAIRGQLRSYFEPHNQRLYEYLGEDLGW